VSLSPTTAPIPQPFRQSIWCDASPFHSRKHEMPVVASQTGKHSLVQQGIHRIRSDLAPTEQKLHVLRSKFFHGDLVVVDSPVDHVRLLLLKHDHTRLDRVLNAQASDDTGAPLPNTMTAIGRLPFRSGIPPPKSCVSMRWGAMISQDLRVDDENPRSLRQIQGYASCFKGNKKDFDVCIVHEVFDRLLTLCRAHAAIQHYGVETCAAKTPLYQLEH